MDGRYLLRFVVFYFLVWSVNEVKGGVPEAPVAQVPVGVIMEVSPLFDWSDVVDAVSYRFVLRDGANNKIHEAPVIESNFQYPNSLQYDLDYKWKVHSRNSSGVSPSSGWKWFSILEETAPNVSPSTISPQGTIYDRTPTFNWTMVSGATRYRVVLRDVDGGSINLISEIVNSTSYTLPSNLDLQKRYKWRVNAANDLGAGPASAFAFFDFNPPIEPIGIEPKGLISEPIAPTFKWSQVQEATSYKLVIISSASNEIIHEVPGITTTTYSLPFGLDSSLNYTWWVYAINSNGSSQKSQAINFSFNILPAVKDNIPRTNLGFVYFPWTRFDGETTVGGYSSNFLNDPYYQLTETQSAINADLDYIASIGGETIYIHLLFNISGMAIRANNCPVENYATPSNGCVKLIYNQKNVSQNLLDFISLADSRNINVGISFGNLFIRRSPSNTNNYCRDSSAENQSNCRYYWEVAMLDEPYLQSLIGDPVAFDDYYMEMWGHWKNLSAGFLDDVISTIEESEFSNRVKWYDVKTEISPSESRKLTLTEATESYPYKRDNDARNSLTWDYLFNMSELVPPGKRAVNPKWIGSIDPNPATNYCDPWLPENIGKPEHVINPNNKESALYIYCQFQIEGARYGGGDRFDQVLIHIHANGIDADSPSSANTDVLQMQRLSGFGARPAVEAFGRSTNFELGTNNCADDPGLQSFNDITQLLNEMTTNTVASSTCANAQDSSANFALNTLNYINAENYPDAAGLWTLWDNVPRKIGDTSINLTIRNQHIGTGWSPNAPKELLGRIVDRFSLVQNSGFENLKLDEFWSPINNYSGIDTVSSKTRATSIVGEQSLNITTTSFGEFGVMSDLFSVPIVARDRQIYVNFFYIAEGVDSIQLKVNWYDINGDFITSDTLESTTVNPTYIRSFVWATGYSIPSIMPNSAVYARLSIFSVPNGTEAESVFTIDAISVFAR